MGCASCLRLILGCLWQIQKRGPLLSHETHSLRTRSGKRQRSWTVACHLSDSPPPTPTPQTRSSNNRKLFWRISFLSWAGIQDGFLPLAVTPARGERKMGRVKEKKFCGGDGRGFVGKHEIVFVRCCNILAPEGLLYLSSCRCLVLSASLCRSHATGTVDVGGSNHFSPTYLHLVFIHMPRVCVLLPLCLACL